MQSTNVKNWLLQDIDNEMVQIEVFKFAYLDKNNRVVVRASPNYYEQAAFFDVCVEMDKSE
ncbi:15697_t:CDS:2 [Funneliformis caledonium]|uniref:15697_t:CDS:1 n=1 Tax=Funneliformis caledonium TaxID=1117310 RepID=A0A9N9AXC0_9GLOM|nr:15697_t:CDS:2 [Funneliformis caledonium]